MSLLAQFDDLCHYSKVLNSGVEEEFKIFVESQLDCMRKWKKTREDVKTLRSKVRNFESQDRRLEKKSIHLRNLLDDSNSAIRKLKWEKECLESTITAVRDIILSNNEMDNPTKEKLSLLSLSYPRLSSSSHLETIEESLGSCHSLSDSDQTYLELENWVNSSNHQSHRVKDKKNDSKSITSTEENEFDEVKMILNQRNKRADKSTKSKATSYFSHDTHIQDSSLLNFKKNVNEMGNSIISRDDPLLHIRRNHQSHRIKDTKYSSETITSTEEKEFDEGKVILNQRKKRADKPTKSKTTSYFSHDTHTQDSELLSFKKHVMEMGQSIIPREDSLQHIRRNHQLVSKKVIRPEKCIVCRQSIGSLKRSLKCQTCGVIFHPECKSIYPMFCFPINNIPTEGTAGTVADYTSSSSPMIPPLIFHCVREIESRGLKEIGLYRIPASERDVNNVIDKFVSKSVIPCLDDVNIHTLCAAVKEFLGSFSEPLVTHKLRQAFIDAATLNDSIESLHTMLELVSDLSQPNLDTLSFLILHWKKIAESPHCKMDSETLSRVLGPTLVGYSTPTAKMIEETTNQYQVMKLLLSISSASWQSMMSVDMSKSPKELPENASPKRYRLFPPVYAFFQERKKSNSSNESNTSKLKKY